MIPIFFKIQLDPTKIFLSLTPFTYDFSLHNLSLFITETFEIAMLGLAKIFCHGSRYKRLRFTSKVGSNGWDWTENSYKDQEFKYSNFSPLILLLAFFLFFLVPHYLSRCMLLDSKCFWAWFNPIKHMYVPHYISNLRYGL